MRVAVYGSSLLSSYWNGAATYYRGIIRALAARGHRVTFFEPDVLGRQDRRDIDPPDWCESRVYTSTMQGLMRAAGEAARADVVVKCSGVGYQDDLLLDQVMAAARPGALRLFWDVDAPATIAQVQATPDHPLRRALAHLDLVLTYGGGPPVVAAYRALGARDCVPICNAVDPATHHPVPPDPALACDLAFLANRLPDRQARVEEFFLGPAVRLPGHRFLLGGAGWDGGLPPSVRLLGHVPTARHNALNCSAGMVLNVARQSMAETGWSPATRVFEAAGAGACLISDTWEGIGAFLTPGTEILLARDGADVAEAVVSVPAETRAAIGRAARARVLREHTYDLRAAQMEAVLLRAAAVAGGFTPPAPPVGNLDQEEGGGPWKS